MTFDAIRAIALAWPEVGDGSSYGTPALKVRGKLLARLREDGETLVLPGIGLDERAMLMEAAPGIFFITPHDKDWPSILLRLPATDAATAKPLLLRRWRTLATKAALKAFDAADGET